MISHGTDGGTIKHGRTTGLFAWKLTMGVMRSGRFDILHWARAMYVFSTRMAMETRRDEHDGMSIRYALERSEWASYGLDARGTSDGYRESLYPECMNGA